MLLCITTFFFQALPPPPSKSKLAAEKSLANTKVGSIYLSLIQPTLHHESSHQAYNQ